MPLVSSHLLLPSFSDYELLDSGDGMNAGKSKAGHRSIALRQYPTLAMSCCCIWRGVEAWKKSEVLPA